MEKGEQSHHPVRLHLVILCNLWQVRSK